MIIDEKKSKRFAFLVSFLFHLILLSCSLPTTELIVTKEKDNPIGFLLILSQALNIWRMPILFFIGGMALSFSSKKRSNKELSEEIIEEINLILN